MRSLKKRVTALACAIMMSMSSLSVSTPITAKAAEGENLVDLSIQAAAEGCVMLKNENNALPLQDKARIALFGRAQNDDNYVFGGKGSGSAPNTTYKVNILEALEAAKYDMNATLKQKYAEFCKSTNSDDNTDDEAGLKAQNEDGNSQKKVASRREMVWTEAAVKEIKRDNETAIVIISRKSGEDADLAFSKGSFLLTDNERAMLDNVSKVYDKVVVLLNTTVMIDMSWVPDYPKIDSILYVWTGGQEAGNGIVKVLSGEVNPCGKLTDTIAKDHTKYPTKDNYGKLQTFYQEDIYVGYRYFETFAPDDVMYPFGYGLSYTTFDTKFERMEQDNGMLKVVVTVTNTGKKPGKEVVQVYYGAPQAPQSKLGNPVKELAAFAKTKEIYPGESQTLSLNFKISEMASYDDGGYTGHENCYVLEAGEYKIYVGSDVHSSKHVTEYQQSKLEVVETLQEALAPVTEFKRYKAVEEGGKIVRKEEDVPLLKTNIEQRIKDNLPKDLPKTNSGKTYKLIDVYNGDVTMEQFVGQMTVEQMGKLAQGSQDVKNRDSYTSGGASYFGGVRCKDDSGKKQTYLVDLYGIPVAVTADGPGGIKIKEKCTMIPCANVLGCTWNLDLIERMYKVLGDELIEKHVDSLLGPGVNIKRDPRCGRNFEYFSEDPLLTGRIAAVMTKAAQESGATLTAKHFACNNCELSVGRNESHEHIWYMSSIRGWADSIVSERALREIYLKVFEIYVKEGNARSVMTAYNPINGCYAASNYDLNTTILREEWGYNGIVMTDWWANMSEKPWASGNMNRNPDRRATMLKAQNDIWMTLNADNDYDANGNQANRNKVNDIINSNKNGYLSLGEIQRSAINICNYLMQSQAFATLNHLDIKEVTKRFEKKTDEWFTVEEAQLGNPEMESITVGGRKLVGFSKNVFRYKVYLPANATTFPQVAATPKVGTNVDVEQATTQNRTAVIKATEGQATVRYNIEFTDEEGLKPVLENPVYASLSDIKVAGTSVEGFDSDTYAYKMLVNSLDGEPAVTWTAPTGVTVTKNYDVAKQTVTLKAVSTDQAVSYSIRFGVLPHSDEFDGTTLSSFWKVDNQNASNLSLTDGHLVISGERGSIWNSQDSLKNRVIQSADGDWEAIVKIDLPKLPSYAYQSLGVMALQDYDNYVYVKMESNGNGYEISLCQESAGTNKTVDTISDADETKFSNGMYVKLRKMGNTYMASVSPDGNNYIRFAKAVSGTYENPKFMLVNGDGEPGDDVPENLQAKFDYVHFKTEGLGEVVPVGENTKVKVAEIDPVTMTAGLIQENCQDTDGGLNLANFEANEEVAFRINVQKAGYYDLTARIACPEAGLYQFRNSTFVDDVFVGQIFGNDTDGAQNWVDMILGSNVKLTPGEHIIRLHADESGFDIAYNLNWVRFKYVGDGSEQIFEAETGNLANKAEIVDAPNCSGGKRIGNIGGPDNGFATFTVNVDKDGQREIIITYCSDDDRDLNVNVNGTDYKVNCPKGNGWEVPAANTVQVTADFKAGDNTVVLSGVKKDKEFAYGPNVDLIRIKGEGMTQEQPTVPSEPANPGEPSAPVNPSDPSAPSTPADSNEPSAPSTPVNPSVPSDPSAPSASVDPSTPDDPTTPSAPSTPADSNEPSAPSTSVNPSAPNDPITPSTPSTPVVPIQPSQPTPTVPTQPSQSTPIAPIYTEQESRMAGIFGVAPEVAREIIVVANQYQVSEATLKVTEQKVQSIKNDKDVAGSSFAKIQAKATKQTKNSVKLSWSKVTGADGYIVYGNECGKGNAYQTLAVLAGGKTTYTDKALDKGTYYKYMVCAYKNVANTKVTLAASKTIHTVTKGGKFGVAKSVNLTSGTVKLKVGKTLKLSGKEVKADKTIKVHRKVAYETSNPAVATITKSGKLKAIGKGKCYVYAYAQNGVFKKVKVAVR